MFSFGKRDFKKQNPFSESLDGELLTFGEAFFKSFSAGGRLSAFLLLLFNFGLTCSFVMTSSEDVSSDANPIEFSSPFVAFPKAGWKIKVEFQSTNARPFHSSRISRVASG